MLTFKILSIAALMTSMTVIAAPMAGTTEVVNARSEEGPDAWTPVFISAPSKRAEAEGPDAWTPLFISLPPAGAEGLPAKRAEAEEPDAWTPAFISLPPK